MSQLRKSASFRSRIPVRRTRIPVRRCCSPQPSSSASAVMSCGGKKTGGDNKGRQQNSSTINFQNHFWPERRYSSTSYSSSDESDESEAPFQVCCIVYHLL